MRIYLHTATGMYIMQNAILGGMEWSMGEKISKKRVRGKNEKGERKTEENYMKNGEKASFWVIHSKIFRDLPCPPIT